MAGMGNSPLRSTILQIFAPTLIKQT